MKILKQICCLLIFVLCCSLFCSYDKTDIKEKIKNPTETEQTKPEDVPVDAPVKEDTNNNSEKPVENELNDSTEKPEETITETLEDSEQPAQPDKPQQSAPQQSAPQQSAPQQSAPQQSAPQQSAPQQSAPQQSAPQQSAPQQSAPVQDVVSTVKTKANETINSVVTSGMTEYQKLKAVYEWLFNNFRYRTVWVDLSKGFTNELTYDLASYYFKYHKGSCEHYAAVQKILFEQMGYEVRYVGGQRYSSEEGAYGTHIWVMIKINGNWYHVDGLFSGNHTASMLTVFCVPDSEIEGTHKWARDKYPACTAPRLAQ